MKGKVDKLDLVRLNADKPVAEIRQATGISAPMIYVYLEKLGIKPVRPNKIDLLPTADELRAEGLTQAGLAVKYNVSIGTIKRRLKAHETKD